MQTADQYVKLSSRPAASRLLVRYLAAVACGVLLAAGFPPLSLVFLIPLGFGGWLLLAYHTERLRGRLLLSYVAGLGFFLPLLWWMQLFGLLPWLLLAGVQALAFPVAALLLGLAAPRPGLLRAGLAAACWTGLEWLRAQTAYGFTWGQLGVSLAAAPVLAQGAAVLGVYGLSFALALLGATLAEWGEGRTRPWLRDLGIVALVVAVAAAGSVVRYRGVQANDRSAADEAQGLTVAIAQGSSTDYMRPDGSSDGDRINDLALYLGLTRQALPRAPYLVVWPESSILTGPPDNPDVSRQLADLAREGACWLLVGAPGYQGDQPRNSAHLYGPAGAYMGRYDKVHLVPFGEFVPGRSRLPLVDRYPVRPFDLTPGAGHVVLNAGGPKLGVMICFESIFPDIGAAYARQGADLLVVITNDAWFDHSAALRQHAQMAALRAIETGRWVVRGGYSGISQVIDPAGRVHAELGIGRRGVLVADTYPAVGTPYPAAGHLFAPACLLLMVLWTIGAVGGRLIVGTPPPDPR